MTHAWHVIRSKPNREDFLARELESREIEVFHPRLVAKPVNPRARSFKPFFPGYVFVHVDIEKVGSSSVEQVPGAANMVSFGGELASVPESIIYAIRRKVDEINASGGVKAAVYQPGDLVEIEQGPFSGYTAILDASLPGSERVRVLLRMLERRDLPVEMPAEYIRLRKPGRKVK